MATPALRLTEAAAHAAGNDIKSLINVLGPVMANDPKLTEPTVAANALTDHLTGRFSLTGTQERRLLLVEHTDRAGTWTIADLSGAPLATRVWPEWINGRITIDDPSRWISTATVTVDGVRRLLQPTILLAALYHREIFPLPRFPLAISDLARAARATLSGQVQLMDMQLGSTIDDILQTAASQPAQIIGVSATFGQHDLMIELLDAFFTQPSPPLVLAGGSLTVRNERLLLDRYPALLVARAAGEPTIADIIAYHHADLSLDQVRGIGYNSAPRRGGMAIRRRHTATLSNRSQTDFLPELDLLPATLRHHGVAQLETSRGCTNFCSFCPRGHKGIWAGPDGDALPWMLDAMRSIFDQYPDVSRTVYLVDEEFIGRGPSVVNRALSVAETLHAAGFRWESSCRVDQVVLPTESRAWHVERATMWRRLVELGLRRMLFGVESGVASILARFNKETTGDQNALAIRTLTALGVPPRFTYITFDHLMTVDELKATHAFQARTDLLLRPQPYLGVQEIVDGVRDDAFVATHSTGHPFYHAVSYLLVSMECLIGAAYTKEVAKAGLTGEVRPAMGRVDARFADWRIGRVSHHAQLWVDRNFPLDYTLKSLEKILDGEPYQAVRAARVIIKTAAFALLGRMIDLITRTPLTNVDEAAFDEALMEMMTTELVALAAILVDPLTQVMARLPAAAVDLLRNEYIRWQGSTEWRLINPTESCEN